MGKALEAWWPITRLAIRGVSILRVLEGHLLLFHCDLVMFTARNKQSTWYWKRLDPSGMGQVTLMAVTEKLGIGTRWNDERFGTSMFLSETEQHVIPDLTRWWVSSPVRVLTTFDLFLYPIPGGQVIQDSGKCSAVSRSKNSRFPGVRPDTAYDPFYILHSCLKIKRTSLV